MVTDHRRCADRCRCRRTPPQISPKQKTGIIPQRPYIRSCPLLVEILGMKCKLDGEGPRPRRPRQSRWQETRLACPTYQHLGRAQGRKNVREWAKGRRDDHTTEERTCDLAKTPPKKRLTLFRTFRAGRGRGRFGVGISVGVGVGVGVGVTGSRRSGAILCRPKNRQIEPKTERTARPPTHAHTHARARAQTHAYGCGICGYISQDVCGHIYAARYERNQDRSRLLTKAGKRESGKAAGDGKLQAMAWDENVRGTALVNSRRGVDRPAETRPRHPHPSPGWRCVSRGGKRAAGPGAGREA